MICINQKFATCVFIALLVIVLSGCSKDLEVAQLDIERSIEKNTYEGITLTKSAKEKVLSEMEKDSFKNKVYKIQVARG